MHGMIKNKKKINYLEGRIKRKGRGMEKTWNIRAESYIEFSKKKKKGKLYKLIGSFVQT